MPREILREFVWATVLSRSDHFRYPGPQGLPNHWYRLHGDRRRRAATQRLRWKQWGATRISARYFGHLREPYIAASHRPQGRSEQHRESPCLLAAPQRRDTDRDDLFCLR